MITDSDQLSRDKRAELRGVISTKPGLNRYLRVTPGGLLRTDAAKAKAEENLDGKYLLRTADPKLSAEDIAARLQAAPGSRARLARHEAGHRPAPGLPPQGRADPRPRHPVLARPPAGPRSPRTPAGRTWPELRRELDRIHVGTFTGPAGTFRQRTEITKAQRDILQALKIDPPPRIYQLKPAAEP